MMKSALLLALFGCSCLAVTAEFGHLFKRQTDPCDISESNVPVECHSFLNYSSIISAVLNDHDVDYCGNECAQPLYYFFKGCDEATGSMNSTEFDFSCSSNAAGDPCVQSVFDDFGFIFQCLGLSIYLERQCTEECRTNLTAASERIGCCAFSYYAVTGGESNAEFLFSLCTDDPLTLCTGGVTDEVLSFPPEPVDVLCEDLVDEVDESCRKYLSVDSFSALVNLDGLCNTDCGQQVYDFNVQCDFRTGAQNSTIIDLLCAMNSMGARCGDILPSLFLSNPFLQCLDSGRGCSDECSSALQSTRDQGGCCFDTAFATTLGIFDLNELYSYCNLEQVDTCIGAFSDEPITPRPDDDDDEECQDLLGDLPEQCLGYIDTDLLFFQAGTDPVTFIQTFCNGECSEEIYNYFVKCDKIESSNDAAFVDFLCTNNTNNEPCIGLLSDEALSDTFDESCDDASPSFCSDACSSALVEPFEDWGCCLFTLTALQDSVNFVEAIIEECKLEADNAKLCVGGLSGEPIAAEEGGEIKDAAVSIVISFTVLIMATLITL